MVTDWDNRILCSDEACIGVMGPDGRCDECGKSLSPESSAISIGPYKVDPAKVLESAIPNRFQDFPPSDFEDFISQLFEDNGYHATQTSYSGDYGADLILTRDEESIAVQVKRYAKGNSVGVKDINQVLGAKDYYNCKTARVITTSSFTKPGRELASKTQTELWDWDHLQKYICDTYLDGKDYYEYFRDSREMNTNDKEFDFQVTRVQYDAMMKGNVSTTKIYINMKNLTNRNITVNLPLPIYITKENKQTEAWGYYEGYFTQGTVYAGCAVELVWLFKSEQVARIHEGGKLVMQWWSGDSDDLRNQECMIDRDYQHPYDSRIQHQPSRDQSCYIVTMCCGRGSREYMEMIFFRDNIIVNLPLGMSIVELYYRCGQYLSDKLSKCVIAKKLSRCFLKMTLPLAIMYNNMACKSRQVTRSGHINTDRGVP